MDKQQSIQYLIRSLLQDMPSLRKEADGFPPDPASQRRLLRSLMNLRPPMPLQQDFLRVQDALLCAERAEKGVVEEVALPVCAADPHLALWRGDITRLRADAIVNAANSTLLACFHPCHGCIDNAIHSAAGLQLRDACHRLIRAQGHDEPVGKAKLTPGYNLPSRYVLHTVGPLVSGQPTALQRRELASCYRSCLELAAEHRLESVAFCCISTGEFHYPHQEAAEIAVNTVTAFLQSHSTIKKVIFNVYQEPDALLYRRLLESD